MIRTVISLEPDEKKWLDHLAKEENTSLTELVRRAVRQYRTRQEEQERPSFDEMLERTRGIWRREDGLEYQTRLRDDWQSRP